MQVRGTVGIVLENVALVSSGVWFSTESLHYRTVVWVSVHVRRNSPTEEGRRRIATILSDSVLDLQGVCIACVHIHEART